MAIPTVNAEECTGCEECVDACPAEAISMKDDVAVIDPDECTECSACVDACPAEAITEDE
jgi:ferredoxin